MKLNVNKLVLASAVVAASGHVAALTPTEIADCRVGGGTCPSTEALLTVDISGASATTQVMQDLAVEICKPGDIAHYKDFIGASKAGKRLNTYACLADGVKVPGVTDGTPILIANQSPGSFEGVGPVARKEPVEFMNVEGGNCTLDTSGAVDEYKCTISTTSPNRTSLWFCSGEDSPGDALTYTRDTRCSIPNGGVSDAEPLMFSFDANSPAPVTQTEIVDLDSDTFIAQPFGVLVTKTFADGLRAEGAETTVGADGFSYPILSSAFIRSSFAAGSLTSAGDVTSLTGDQAKLAVCRRALGSGTHAVQNLQFMGTPCHTGPGITGNLPFDVADVNIDNTDAATNNGAAGAWFNDGHATFEGQGSSDMAECLEDAEDGTMAGQLNNNTIAQVVTPGANLSAIGYQSFGKKEGGVGDGEAAPDSRWQYVAIDGVEPTIDNVADGNYSHFWEATLQWIAAGKSGAPSTDQISLLTALRDSGGKTSVIDAAGASGKIVGTSGSDTGSAKRANYIRYGNSCAEPKVNTNG